MAHGGHCVARHESRVVFVRHALPGERVVALVTEGRERDRFLRADAIEVLVASTDRVSPPCPFAGPGRCGGCDWQHASIAAQRRLKASVVTEQLQRLAGLDVAAVEVEPVQGDDDGLGWRTRVQFVADAEGRLGLRRHRSHTVVVVDRCRIAHPAVDSAGVTEQRWPAGASVEVVVGPEDRAVVVRSSEPATRLRLPSPEGATAMLISSNSGSLRKVRGRGWVRELAAGRAWRVSGDGFWQVHPGAADALVSAVLDGLQPRPGERGLDLFSGVGLFAAALAERVGVTGSVTAVESNARAVADARRNLHDLPNVRLICDRVERSLSRLPGDEVDVVVLDPPRSGAGRAVVSEVARRRPRAVAYVACDPAALARDLAYLRDEGYLLNSLRAFDLFPMTHHVECVAVVVPVPVPVPCC